MNIFHRWSRQGAAGWTRDGTAAVTGLTFNLVAPRIGSEKYWMALFYMVLAVVAGAMLPAQAAINARLGRVVGSSVWAATISGLVLSVALALVASATMRAGPRTAGLGTLPWWAWSGGLCGAVMLSATTAIAPRLGTASLIALVMSGQVVCSLALDNYGLLGMTQQPASGKRLAAAVLLLAGAALMR